MPAGIFRSSRSQMFYKIDFLENSEKCTGKRLCCYKCLPMNFAKFLRKLFYKIPLDDCFCLACLQKVIFTCLKLKKMTFNPLILWLAVVKKRIIIWPIIQRSYYSGFHLGNLMLSCCWSHLHAKNHFLFLSIWAF